jgi:hypothetical protein
VQEGSGRVFFSSMASSWVEVRLYSEIICAKRNHVSVCTISIRFQIVSGTDLASHFPPSLQPFFSPSPTRPTFTRSRYTACKIEIRSWNREGELTPDDLWRDIARSLSSSSSRLTLTLGLGLGCRLTLGERIVDDHL